MPEKVEEWLAAGARLIWALDPTTRSIVDYRSRADIRIYTAEEAVDAEPAPPGFAARAAAFFGLD